MRALSRILVAMVCFGTVSSVEASVVDVTSLCSNSGFENGSASGWALTRPTFDYVSAMTPSVNPVINPADPQNDPAKLTAPDGTYFTGVKRIGSHGFDLAFKLTQNPIAVSVPTGTVFQIKVFANRGRLEPFDTPGSTADLSVRLFGWLDGRAAPTVNVRDSWNPAIDWNPSFSDDRMFDFTSVPDGEWASRVFTFDPAEAGIDAATLTYLTVSVAGRTHGNDEYVATDIAAVPEPGTLGFLAIGAIGILSRRRKV